MNSRLFRPLHLVFSWLGGSGLIQAQVVFTANFCQSFAINFYIGIGSRVSDKLITNLACRSGFQAIDNLLLNRIKAFGLSRKLFVKLDDVVAKLSFNRLA